MNNSPNHHFSYQEKRTVDMNVSLEEIEEVRNRSVSLKIKIPKEFIPKLKPKKNTIIPSPIVLSSLNLNYFSNINLVSNYSLSFDNNDPCKEMRKEMEGRIRSKTQCRCKDDTVILNTDKLLREYVNLSRKKIYNHNSCDNIIKRGSLEFWSLEREKDSSILGYLESAASKEKLL